MRTKVLVIAMLLFAYSASAQIIDYEYQGIGVLKVQQGDVIKVLPNRAFVINSDIYELGLKALSYVKTNKSDSIIEVLERQVVVFKDSYDSAINGLDGCVQDNKKVLSESIRRIDELKNLTATQKDKINILEYQAKEEAEILKRQRQKSRRRTAILIPISGLVAWLGYQYFK